MPQHAGGRTLTEMRARYVNEERVIISLAERLSA